MELALCDRCRGHAIDGVCLRCLCAAEPAPIVIPHIELGDEMGRGGSAIVYEGRRRADGSAVAVKVFASDVEHDGATVARFHREAALLRSLPHPNILAIEGWGEVDGRHYIITELAVGGPISDRIPLEPPAAIAVVRDVCAALAFAHAHGIVHRDVKPQNVLVAADGTIKLGDFGTARQLTSNQHITETGDVVGTPYYMAPEAMHGASHDPRMDVYAVGVLLYHLITGTLPVGYFEPLTGALDPVVRRALAHNPQLRYATIEELSRELVRTQSRPRRAAWRAVPLVVLAGAVGMLLVWRSWSAETSHAVIPPDASLVADLPPDASLDTSLDADVQPDGDHVVATQPRPTTTQPIERRPDRLARTTRAGSNASLPLDGTITIVVRPWAEVQIDGVPRGRAEPPAAGFRVAAGEHTVVLSHPTTGVQTTRRIRVEGNAVVEIRADLGRATSDAP